MGICPLKYLNVPYRENNKRICDKSLNKKLLIFSLFIIYNKTYNYLILFNISINDFKSLQKSENYKKNT